MNKQQVTKKRQCLFAWAELYKRNQRFDEYDKTQAQIDELDRKYGNLSH